MQPAGIVTLIGVLLAVAALAFYLIAVAVMLQQVASMLDDILAALRSIVDKTQPVGGVVSEINRELSDAHERLRSVLERRKEEEEEQVRRPRRRRRAAS